MDKTMSILLSYQPIMAVLAQKCRLRWTDKCPTAGVRILPNGVIELLVNPEFFDMQSPEERVGLMWHEMYHLIAGHIESSYGLDPEVANVAMDEAINQLIPQRFLPKKAILPEYFRHEKLKHYEYYYLLHKERGDSAKYQQKKKYEGGLDDEKNKQDLKDKIKKALDEQKQKQQELSDKLSDQKGDNQSCDKDTQKEIEKQQDQIEDRQEELSERMSQSMDQESTEKSDDLCDDFKNNRSEMKNNSQGMSGNSPSNKQEEIKKDLKDLSDLQDKIDEALSQLEEIQNQEKQRQSNKDQGQKGDQQESSDGSGNDGSPEVMDSHDMWNESPCSQEEQKVTLRNIIQQAVQDTERQFGSGSIPTEIRDMLNKTLEKPKVKWQNLLKNYLGRCLFNDQEYSRKKASRKYGFLAPGKTTKFGPKVICAVDCSGSVSEDEYREFFVEFSGIAKEFLENIEVIFFDDKVLEEKFMLGSGTRNFPGRRLHGGTNFQCVIDYAEKRKPNLLIVLTDGACDTPKKPRFPVLWGILGGRDNPNLFGKRVMISLNGGKQNGKAFGE